MRYDNTETRLMACNAAGPAALTTDLEDGAHFDETIMAATTSTDAIDGLDDDQVVRMFTQVLMDKYADTFPPSAGLEPREWLPVTAPRQMADLCRAVARVEDAIASYAVRHETGVDNTQILWTPATRSAMQAAYARLHREVQQVAADVSETMFQFLEGSSE